MKLVITESQLNRIMEIVENGVVTCDNCGWEWNIADGGNDPYTCHKCGETVSQSEKEFLGEKVKVYYNLHKHTFSVTLKNKVILHADFVKLKNVEFRVRPGGMEKVRQEKSKNVHAFVIGELVDYCTYPCDNIPEEPAGDIITYDPYKYNSFVYKQTKKPIYNAKEVDMINSRNKLFVIEQ